MDNSEKDEERIGTVKWPERANSSRRDQEKNEQFPKNNEGTENAGSVTSAGRPQTRIERPVSRRGLQSAQSNNVTGRATTPARNAIARPPSSYSAAPAGAYSQRIMSGGLRLGTTASPLTRLNTGLPTSAQINMNVLDRPITQQGIAGVRPGTTRGLPINRQIQDKRYYEGLVQLKIRELSQEIGTISREIEAQNKERATFVHYDDRAKELAGELSELQGQLADYNIVIDKGNWNVDEDAIEKETREMAAKNDAASTELERLFEQRRLKEQQLRDAMEKIESERKNAARVIETMDRSSREKYSSLEDEKSKLEIEIGKMQREIDVLSGEKRQLEEEIALSQIKGEAVKLRVKLVQLEAKRDRLQKEEINKTSPEEEREHLLSKVKQDNMDIGAGERRIADTEKRINLVEQELEQLETDLEESNTEKQVKYKELRKREEAMEQFMPSFDNNKKEEIEKMSSLEASIVERLEQLSYAIEDRTGGGDARITPSEEIALMQQLVQTSSHQIPPDSRDDYSGEAEHRERSGSSSSFEGLSREHGNLQRSLAKMETLEKRLKNELNELNDQISKRLDELVVLEDLDGLKAKSDIEYENLLIEKDELMKRQPICKQEVEATRIEHDKIKKVLDKNETYQQINALEIKLDQLRESKKNIEEYIAEGRNRVNYRPLRDKALKLANRYNIVLGAQTVANTATAY
ncbi:intraflagellar transport protein 74 homolog [Venturia canescens]|uniref:intraflagellar transport protein 74 homolog n=1 Tax=Venturia canescens TaxID=32260 RepID=UPI001C9C9D2D|nr:intraflagellar transport protein 74 homolog [Venturia canescens]